jgi:hypothetical protein
MYKKECAGGEEARERARGGQREADAREADRHQPRSSRQEILNKTKIQNEMNKTKRRKRDTRDRRASNPHATRATAPPHPRTPAPPQPRTYTRNHHKIYLHGKRVYLESAKQQPHTHKRNSNPIHISETATAYIYTYNDNIQ